MPSNVPYSTITGNSHPCYQDCSVSHAPKPSPKRPRTRNLHPLVPMLVLARMEQVTTKPSLRPKLFPLPDERASCLGRRVLRDFDKKMWILLLREEEEEEEERWG